MNLFYALLLCLTLGPLFPAQSQEKEKLLDWQKAPLSLYQVNERHLLVETFGHLAAGNIQNSTAQETDKIESYAGDLNVEFGFSPVFSGRVEMGYFSGKQKNTVFTTKKEGFKDIAGLLKIKIQGPGIFLMYFDAGVETSLEALKVDSTARTITASSGGTKVVAKGGFQSPQENLVYGGWVEYKYFVRREMQLSSTLGEETLNIDGGNLLGVGGLLEYGSGLRTGLEIKWQLQNRSDIKSVTIPSLTTFELDNQQVGLGAYLKVPAGEKILMFIRGEYDFNPNKKRGDQNYDRDELYQAQVGLQALF